MMFTTIYTFTLITSILFMQMNHPLAMGLTLLIQTTLICMMTGTITKSMWFSYILFLVFLGGMLVLFIYVTSLASNEMFSLSTKLLMITLTILAIYLLTSPMVDKLGLYSITMNNEMMSVQNNKSYITENSLDLMKLYNYPNNMITLILINYLLISLIAMVKITNVSHGPLRPTN